MSALRSPVVITQCHVRFGFNVALCLVADGYAVVAGGEQYPTMNHGMRGVLAEFRYPNPFLHPGGYVKAVADVLNRYESPVFIATHEDVFVASHFRGSFPSHAKLLVPEIGALLRLHDKYNLRSLCDGLPFRPPETILLAEGSRPDAIARQVGLPFVVKPRMGEGTVGVRVIRSIEQAEKCWSGIQAALRREDFLAQCYIDGKGLAVGVLMDGGRMLATSQHKRLREVPPGGGTSTSRLVEPGGSLGEAAGEVLRRAAFSGVAMLEFRVADSDAQPYLLDVNPRYWGGLSAHILSGVRYPTLHVRRVMEFWNPGSVVTPSRRVESRWLLGEVRSALGLLLRLRFGELRGMLFPRHEGRVLYDELLCRSFWPMLVQMRAYAARFLASLPGMSVRAARAAFFRSLAENRAK